MRNNSLMLATVIALLANLIGVSFTPSPAGAAPEPAHAGGEVGASQQALPAWFSPRRAATSEAAPTNRQSASSVRYAAPTGRQPASTLLPAWFSPADALAAPDSRLSDRLASPPARPVARDIPLSLLTVDVIGPPVASLGSPPGAGEVYTAVIRNTSTEIAYGVYLTATHRSFMIYDGGSSLISRTGSISVVTSTTASGITWTPVPTYNLAPGEAITLNFKLRASCEAESGKRLEIGVNYNADPPPADPIETNTGALNVTTGRGNLVIKKEPALQNLSTPDFGKPITWTITVQNTGLGKLYNAVITDDGGIALGPPTLTPPTRTIPLLDVNETRVYTAVGTVEACNLTNVAQAAWPCGNKVGDATADNPLSSTVSVLFTPQVPDVSVQVSSPLTFPYCDAVTRTVVVTISNVGGPAADFRLDTTLDSDVFLEIVTSSVSSGWQYAAGLFSFTAGSPTGTLPGAGGGGPVTLTFDVRPRTDYVCGAGEGEVVFSPLYNDVCTGDPFVGRHALLEYGYAQDDAPTLHISKEGPDTIASGEVFTYRITVWGQNPASISGTVFVTDFLPSQFELLGPITPSLGTANADAHTVTWDFDPPDTPSPFTHTLTYLVRAITETGGICGASLIVENAAQAFAIPTCPGCAPLHPATQVETAIENNEGVFPERLAFGSLEACNDQGFTIVNRYLITGSTVVTWANAAFTEALGTPIGAGALTDTVPLIYRDGSLLVTVNGVDYTADLTPTVTVSGQLYVDLSPLEWAVPAVPTQNFTLIITYTVEVSEASLDGLVERTFYDWSQLYLPNSSSSEICARNNAFNQVIQMTIGRGDLEIGLDPPILDKCSVNTAIVTMNDGTPGRQKDHVVITFTSSITEVASARNFTYTGSLAGISPITVTSGTIGGGRAIITFTLPPDQNIDGDGAIRFDVDVNCTDEAPWQAGVAFQSFCNFTYGDATTLDHEYHTPNLLLFTTPIKYTVREKDVLWKFFVTNNGNLTATNVVVTNTVQGLTVYTYTPDGPGITLTGALPLTNTDVVFNVSHIAPGEQRAVTVTARVIQCDPLGVVVVAEHGCYSTVCSRPQAEITFNTPDPYLLTNNGETADLPMCDVGEVVFTTKNASPDVSLYQLNVTETLRGLSPAAGEPITVTILRPDDSVAASTTAFTPTQVISGAYPNQERLLIWRAISATTDVYTWFNALPPLYVVRILVPVRTSCVPPNVPQSFANADALGPCGKKLGYTEDAVTLQTLQPNMNVEKDGRVTGGDFENGIDASPGQTVTWRIRVYNYPTSRSYVAQNVVLSDTWPFNFDFITATQSFTPTINPSTRTVTWRVGDMNPQAAPLEFFITGTVVITDGACSPSTTNRALLHYGCDFDGCTSSAVPMDTAQLGTVPELRTILAPDPLHTCEGDIPITIRNYGATAYTNTLTVTLPAGYVYSETVSAGLTPSETITTDPSAPQFRWDVIPGRVAPDPYYEFTLVLRVQNSGSSGACPVADGGVVTATMGYDNHPICSAPGPWITSTATSLVVHTPLLEVAKTPRTQTVDADEPVTWTVSVENVGSGIAENVVITDVAGSNYRDVTATVGSDGAVPTVVGNTVTWVLSAPIGVGQTWTATVMALLNDTGVNRNVVTATAYCATGCETAVVSNTAHTTLLQDFGKYPHLQTGTVGSLAVFTFTSFLPDVDALYEDLTLTDTLPAGLGYVSSALTYTEDDDSSSGGPTTTVALAPSSAPPLYDDGPVVWALGDLHGTVQMGGVITAVIQDDPASHDGARLTNDLRMTYTDDGRDYVYTDTADVDVQEPILHLGKRYVTPRGCAALLFEDNFNDQDASGWSTLGTWSANQGAYRQTASSPANRRAFAGDQGWTDYSFSFMMRTDDPTGSMGGYVRQNNAGTVDTGYLFRWQNGGVNPGMRLEQRNPYVLLDYDGSINYEPGRWYHVEIRVTGDLIEVFVDGARRLSATNSTHPVGRIGLLSSSQDVTEFDDVLVTRLDEMACTVGAGDLVTYTLTISNQGRLPAYDLVVTDSLPGGLSLHAYSFTSDDPDTITTTQPAPIPGATGDLVWGFNQLTLTHPFAPLSHPALTITAVLRVADWITANVVLPNQASLTYDAWPGATQPTTVTRKYSGGSHSTAVRTVNGGLTKTVAFSPPPTATLGSLVTYTLIAPHPVISATLYDVVISDTLDSRLAIEAVTFTGGTGGSASWAAQTVTATFASIPHHTQAVVTVTARISDGLGSNAGSVITNSGVMTHATGPLTSTPPVTTVVGEPALALVKASEPPTSHTVGSGDPVTYRVAITNVGHASGPSPAYDVVFTDTLPQGMRDGTPTLVAITLDGAPVNAGLYVTGYAAGVFTVVFTPTPAFSIPVGSVLQIEYVATVDADVGAGLDLTNTARVAWSSLAGETPGDRDYVPIEDDTTVHTVLPTIDKDVVPPTATLGSLVTYTIRVPHPPITATLYHVTVTDRLDGRLQLHAVVTDGYGTVEISTPSEFTVTYPSIPSGAQRVITVTAVLSSPLGADWGDVITNQAHLAHDTGSTVSDRPAFTVTEPALSLLKASPATSSTVGAGDVVTYTVLVTNWDAPFAAPAYDVVVTDALPAYVTLFAPIPVSLEINGVPVSDFTSSYASGALTVALADAISIPVGGVLTLVYHGRVDADAPAGVDLINHVSVTWSSLAGDVPGERDYLPQDDVAIVHTGYPTLTLVKSAALALAGAGELLTYTLTAVNTGLVSATNVTITDVTPLHTTFFTAAGGLSVEHPPPGGTGVVTWHLGTLGINAPRVVTMVVTVDSPLPDGTLLTNTAWITCTEGVTDTDEITTPVGSAPALELVKSSTDANGGELEPGDRITYALRLSNTGNLTATDVVVSDTIPDHTVYVPGSISGGDDRDDSGLPVLTWTVNTLPPDAPVVLTFAVTAAIPLTNGASIRNAAYVTSTEGVTDTDEISDTVVASHILVVNKSVTPTTISPAGYLTYTLAYTVSGNEPVHDVTISDTVPAHTTFVTATLPHVRLGRLVVWPVGDFLPVSSAITRASGVVTMVVRVNTPLTNGLLIRNVALITDTSSVTDTGAVTTPVESWHDLIVTKTAASPLATAGGLLTYTIAWQVVGTEPALGVTLSDTTPAHTTFQAAIPPAASHPGVGGVGPVVWSLGDQNPPASGSVTLAVLVDSPLLSGTHVFNAVVITDTSVVTDTGAVTTPVESWHDLIVTKTAASPLATAGGLLTYTIAWQVVGTEPALGVTLSDTTPAHTTFQAAIPPAASHPGVGGVGPVVWSLGDQNPPASGSVTLAVLVDSELLSGTHVLNAIVLTDTQGVTDTDTVSTPVETAANLAIVKLDQPDPVAAGARLTYTLVVTNNGPGDAANVVVSDRLPPEVTFITATTPVTVALPDLSWPLGSLTAGAVRYVTVAVQVNPDVTHTFTNTAVVGSDTPDEDDDDNEDDEPTAPLQPGIEVSKTVAPTRVVPHQPFTYTIRVTNVGQVPFDPLALTDTLPPGFNYVVGSGNPSDPDVIAEPLLRWFDLGRLDPDASLTVAFAVTVTRGITGVHVNVVTATGVTPGGPITDTDDTPVSVDEPAVAVDKRLAGWDRKRDVITFTIVVSNVGPVTLDVIPLLDDYDYRYLSFASALPHPNEVVTATGLLLWRDLTASPHGFGRNLPPGEWFEVTTVFSIVADITRTINTAVITEARDTHGNPTDEDDDDEPIVNIPTAIALRYLRASLREDGVLVEWATSTELDVYGFEIQRADRDQFDQARQIAFQAGQGSRDGAEYAYLDKDVGPELRYWYWVIALDNEEGRTRHGPVSVTTSAPDARWHRVYLPVVLR